VHSAPACRLPATRAGWRLDSVHLQPGWDTPVWRARRKGAGDRGASSPPNGRPVRRKCLCHQSFAPFVPFPPGTGMHPASATHISCRLIPHASPHRKAHAGFSSGRAQSSSPHHRIHAAPPGEVHGFGHDNVPNKDADHTYAGFYAGPWSPPHLSPPTDGRAPEHGTSVHSRINAVPIMCRVVFA
jgi:hypothetical protein